jgi:hypothetical protein
LLPFSLMSALVTKVPIKNKKNRITQTENMKHELM